MFNEFISGVYTTDTDPILCITDPTQVTPQAAEKYINELQKERDNMTTMRDSLSGGLAHLGAELYSSQVGLIIFLTII